MVVPYFFLSTFIRAACSNSRSFIAYYVKDTGAGEHGETRGVWTKVGAAWANKDGKDFSVVLDVIPLDGRLRLREPLERNTAGVTTPSEV